METNNQTSKLIEANQALVDQIIAALNETLMTGNLPANLPVGFETHAGLLDLLNKLVQIQQLVMAIANGNLEANVHMRGRVAGTLKSLQANLRHLTWQTQRIADGDLSQRVAFMGDFSTAFNTMVEQIAQSRADLELRAKELAEQHQVALDLMAEANAARQAVEKANRILREQLVEIQTLQLKLREQAIRDPLTGCFNRRYLQEIIEPTFARARDEHYPISILMIDLDRFKTINDTYGHKTGDEVLVALGRLLLGQSRCSDTVTRYGGEEFLVMLPGIPLPAALERAETIRTSFAALQIEAGGQVIACTLSTGLAVFPDDGAAEYGIIEKADQALYRAKAAGRNCVVAYQTLA